MRDMTTQVWFNDTKFIFGADDEEGLMDFTAVHEDEPTDYEGRHWSAALTPDEMEYLAHRMLDAVAYQRRQYGLDLEHLPQNCEPCGQYEPVKEVLGRRAIINALERNGNDRKKAAAYLGISARTLYRRMKQYGIDI